MYLPQTLVNIVRLLKDNGLFVFTCATIGREEHGTILHDRNSSPLTSTIDNWCDYYENVTEAMIRQMIDVDQVFAKYEFEVRGTDLRFWGIKNIKAPADCQPGL